MEKAMCKYCEVCGLNALDTEKGLCILHSEDSNKDKTKFGEALEEHRKNKGENFSYIVFPYHIEFIGVTFSENVNFKRAKFLKGAKFFRTRFSEGANFSEAEFSERADFSISRFYKEANFFGTKFLVWTDFLSTTFYEDAKVTFFEAKFSKGANFWRTTFRCDYVKFSHAAFFGNTVFAGKQEEKMFSEVEIDFRHVIISPLDSVTFKNADLSKCLLQGTSLREANLTAVKWDNIPNPLGFERLAVYDEKVASEMDKKKKERHWEHIEEIYRGLKKSYEYKGDHERAGDFHYGEKEMRRKNQNTSRLLRCFLTIYWVLSGYGERYLRPLLAAIIVILFGAFGYLALGVAPSEGKPILQSTEPLDWLRAAHYSLRVMALFKPTGWVLSECAEIIRTVQNLLGPVIIGLFALAIRQRLKR